MRAPGGITSSADYKLRARTKGTATIAGGDSYCVYDLKYVLSDGETYYKRDLDICQITATGFSTELGPWHRSQPSSKADDFAPCTRLQAAKCRPYIRPKPVDPGKSRCS